MHCSLLLALHPIDLWSCSLVGNHDVQGRAGCIEFFLYLEFCFIGSVYISKYVDINGSTEAFTSFSDVFPFKLQLLFCYHVVYIQNITGN